MDKRSAYQSLQTASEFYHWCLLNTDKGKEAQQYLFERGITMQSILQFKLGFASENWQNLDNVFKDGKSKEIAKAAGLIKEGKGRDYSTFRNRIMFPILNRVGKVAAFGGRKFIENDEGPKYLNSEETLVFNKSRELYNLVSLRGKDEPVDRVIITEGYLDVVSSAQYGHSETVATLGTTINSFQLKTLTYLGDRVFIVYDGDKAGHDAAIRALAGVMSLNQQERDKFKFVLLQDGEDLDSILQKYGSSGLNKIFTSGISATDLLENTINQRFDNTNFGRAKAIDFRNSIQPVL